MSGTSKVNVPIQSVVHSTLENAHFFDAYQIVNPHSNRSALQIWLDTVGKTPVWIDKAMRLRNFVVSKMGLKDLGKLSDTTELKLAHTYKVGDRVGIFTVSHISDSEVVMGDDDKHLAVQVSLCKLAGNQIVLSTVVHIHNWLGHVYMFFVKPMHRIIAPAVLSKI